MHHILCGREKYDAGNFRLSYDNLSSQGLAGSADGGWGRHMLGALGGRRGNLWVEMVQVPLLKVDASTVQV